MKLNRELVSFSLASLFNDIGVEMIAPIWPLFLTTILGANVAILGLIEGISVAVVAISQSIAGWWSDKVGKRKPFIAAGYLFSSAARAGYSFSANWLQVIPFKVMDHFGRIRGAPRDAMIAELTEKKERGKSFGFLGSMDTLGGIVGITITLIIINYFTIRSILLMAVIPSFISFFVIIFLVKERKGKKLFKGFSLKMNTKLKFFTIITVIFTLFSFTYSFLIVYAKSLGASDQLTITYYLIMNIIYTVFSYQFGKLSDKINRFKVILLGLIFFSLTCLLTITASNLIQVLIVFALFGFYLAVFDPVQKTIVSELAPVGRKGGIIGTYQMIIGLTAIPGGLLMGSLYDFNKHLPFIIGLTASLICMILTCLLVKKK